MIGGVAQVDLMDRVEALFNRFGADAVHEIERELILLGFVQKGADPAVIAMEHSETGLFLEIDLDGDGRVHGYDLIPRRERGQKQERYRR
jgi:hypothetical protein